MEWKFILNRIPYFGLVFIRISSLLAAMPLFGTRGIPPVIRVWITIAFCWAMLPIIPFVPSSYSLDLPRWVQAAVSEAAIGFTMGWLVGACLSAVPLAGQVIGYQMGLGMANVFDPVEQQQLSIMARFLYLLAVWMFFAMDGHHLIISALLESFRAIPPGQLGDVQVLGKMGIAAGGYLFTSALLLAAPALMILLFVQIAMGIVARTVPQMNVFIVGIPLQIGVGLLAVAGTLGFFTPWWTAVLHWMEANLLLLKNTL